MSTDICPTDYAHLSNVQTRWHDNDIYGHVNNVVYYSYFDSLVNRYLIEQGGLDIHQGSTVGFVVESGCKYLNPIVYPNTIQAGLRVGKLGNSSVKYELALFNEEGACCAVGFFVHVFVDRKTNRPTPIPDKLRTCLQALVR